MGQGVARLMSVARETPRLAIVLGSGLAPLRDSVVDPVTVPFSDLAGLPAAGVAGHTGDFVLGRLGGLPVCLLAGRLHLYEGHGPDAVALPTRIMAGLGVRDLLLTNAAGGIHPAMVPGTLVLLDDQINLTFRSPLTGSKRSGEVRFPDMSAPFDAGFAAQISGVAVELGLRLESGSYVGIPGPSYETAAEIRMLRRMGADLVGMSTVNEVVAARAAGLRVAAISLVTNRATGLAPAPLDHREVLAVGATASERLGRLIEGLIRRLDREPPGRQPPGGAGTGAK